jgi:protein tyrosine phosphatase
MENTRDLSGEYVNNSPVLLKAEKPLPFNEFLYHSRARDKHTEFLILKRITETAAHQEYLESDICNSTQNRYKDILPYRDTRVPLSASEYINASYIIAGPANQKRLIAAQGPLSNTVNLFWKMIWEQEVKLVVMCCGFVEDDVPKCFEYFPVIGSRVFGEFEIQMENEKQKFSNVVKRTLLICDREGTKKKVAHLEITGWMDNSAPEIRESFSSLNYVIFMIQHKLKKYTGRVLVHCSAGIGRTGVLLGLYEMVIKLENSNSSEEVACVSVFRTVRKLREQRWGMVVTEDQYKFMYSFMEYWITTFLLQ